MTDNEPDRDVFTGYIGGDVAPADLWGRAPIRGHACRVVEDAIDAHGDMYRAVEAFRIVDALIEAGILPDETATQHEERELLRQAALTNPDRCSCVWPGSGVDQGKVNPFCVEHGHLDPRA